MPFAACVLGADEPVFQPEMLTAVVSPLELCPKLVVCGDGSGVLLQLAIVVWVCSNCGTS